MSDDAQTPEAREHSAGGSQTGAPHTGDVWPAPADGGAENVVPQDGSLVDVGTAETPDAAGTPDPWAPPRHRTPADGRSAGGGRAVDRSETLAAGDNPQPWSAPSVPSAPTSPSVHDQQTVTSFPAMGEPAPAPYTAQPWAGPSVPQAPAHSSAPTPAVNPFAPPAGGEPVPPPPVGPEGPGRMPYGYPGGYGGTPGPAPYGWSGMAAPPSNGMGVTGLVLGIISAVVFCIWPVAILLGVLAVIFGGIGRGKAARGEATNAGQALAGIICGAVGSALGVGFGILILVT
ncbi:DUF4190 domain-containing protein [Streptomyces capillispiralis]|uniref:DUF4190 domain-containing protein n=1 Tax=Streptomyces capillispiralis TaxID=68182 RepID=A0A561TCS8_9ACTN|nr:DUF4190 domain-containing protein [Streptomyces capillispiralis]TWF84918.1 hypothetical protein FHX78_111860 [Streptomyces capillispiralis]GHH96193.1 hypothetical protein GCM10017779_66500 [Streptomyces capillispiralis]